VGALPVCGENEKLIGMVTDRDITIRATADGCDPHETTVEEVMTHDIITCFEDQDLADMADLMEEEQVRRICVLNRSNRLVGIVSLGDLAIRSDDDRLSAEALDGVS